MKSFVVSEDPYALSAGNEIKLMLENDDVIGQPSSVPLFRDPEPARKYHTNSLLIPSARYCNAQDTSSGYHSLKTGGATSYSSSPSGVDMIAGYMGRWTLAARDDYIDACSEPQ